MRTCGQAIPELLEAYGIEVVFGIPGVHTVELYRGLSESKLRHVTPRHEQGAALMALGYAAATGRPAACFLTTGPGILNAATAIGEAYADSHPMVVVCSTNRTNEIGMGGGRLHEVASQRAMIEQITAFTHTLLSPANLPELMARAFTLFETGRPRPVCIEIPTDILAAPTDADLSAWPLPRAAAPNSATIADFARRMKDSKRPLLLFGGGCASASDEALALAELLDAPVVLTQAAKGVVPENHPLCLGFTLPLPPIQRLVDESDVVLAVGTELGEVDRFMASNYAIRGDLLRIDICPDQLTRNARPADVLLADARTALRALISALEGQTARRPSTDDRLADIRQELDAHRLPRWQMHHRLMDLLRDRVPAGTIISADSSQLAYSGAMHFPSTEPRTWLFPANFGSLGTGLPMAIGAKIGRPDRTVVCIAGDGGFLFTIEELATAVEEKMQIIIVLWNNDGYGEIRDAMSSRSVTPIGVDFTTTDFIGIARGFGCEAERAGTPQHFVTLLDKALAQSGPTIIEVHENDASFWTHEL
ncbi:MAG: 5-guanidino-2-oxopentanoate decarboxylase [Parvibaculaceae bacterium]